MEDVRWQKLFCIDLPSKLIITTIYSDRLRSPLIAYQRARQLIRLAFVLDRLEARVLRAGPPPKKGPKQPTPTLHLYDLEAPGFSGRNA